MAYLHERREQIPVGQIGWQCGVEPGGGYGEGGTDSLESQRYWEHQRNAPKLPSLDILLLPFRITASSIATKSDITASAS